MEKEKDRSEELFCPVGRFFADIEKTFGGTSDFMKHLKGSRIEFLKAIRSLVDGKIEDLEKKGAKKDKKKSSRIKVE